MKTIILEERGYFWWHDDPIPTGHFAPDSAITGVLKIEEDGRIELELDGFMPREKGAFPAFFDPEEPASRGKSIQGRLKSNNKSALLTGLLKYGGKLNSNGVSYERFLAANCLVGDSAFPQLAKPMRFRNLQVDLKGFEEWLRLGSIETRRTKTRISAKYKKPKDISYPLDNGTLLVKYDIFGPYLGKQMVHDLKLCESVSIAYRLNKSAPLADMQTQYGLLEDLLILLTDSDYCLDWPILSYGRSKKTCTFYFLRSRSSAAPPKWHECWTNFVQIRNDFGKIFSSWRKKRGIFGPGFYLYLGTRRGIKLYVEHRFVNLIWGIESLHRRRDTGPPKPSKLNNKIQRILGQVAAKKDKEWLGDQLRHADEPALEQRIFETFKDLPLGLDEKKLRRFSTDCARSRNDISHFGGQREDGNYAEFIAELDKKSSALSYLYHTLLLQEIGVDATILKWWVHEGFQSGKIKRVLAQVGLLDKSILKQTGASKTQ